MKRGIRDILTPVFKVICVVFILFHLFTAYFGVLDGNAQKTVHLGFVLAVCFLLDLLNEKKSKFEKVTAVISMVLGLSSVIYVTVN